MESSSEGHTRQRSLIMMKLLNITNSWCGKVFVTHYVKKMSYTGHTDRHTRMHTYAHTWQCVKR